MTNVQAPAPKPKSRARRVLGALAIVLSIAIIGAAAIGALYISRTQNTTNPTDDAYGVPQYSADQGAAVIDDYHWGGVPAYIADALRDCPGNGTRKENGDLDIAKQRPCLHGMPAFQLAHGTIKLLVPYTNVTLTGLNIVDKTVDGTKDTYRTYDFTIGGDHQLFAAVVREKDAKGAWSTWTYIPEFGEAEFQDKKVYQIAFGLRKFDAKTTASPEVSLPEGYDFDWATIMPQMLHN